jgi:hypothetical protein
MPTWLSIPIILLCLLGGGWMIHWYVVSDPISHEIKVLGEPARPVVQAGGGPNRGPNGGRGAGVPGGLANVPVPHMILEPRNQHWDLRTQTARVDVSLDKGLLATAKVNYHSMAYNNPSHLPEDVRNTLLLTRRLTADTDRTEKLKLSKEQVNKLRSLAFSATNIAMSPADREVLGEQITRVIEATDKDRPAMEPGLYASLDEIAKHSLAPSLQMAVEHVKQINQIMTPDLWKQYTDMGGGK